MSKKGIILNAVVIVLGLAIISMSVGYAAFDTSIKIEGSTTFQSTEWDVHLENPVKTVNSTIDNNRVMSAPMVNQAGTEVAFSLNMHDGDVYEFSVDVKNAGSFNAKLSSYTLIALKNGMNVAINKETDNLSELTYEVLDVEDGEVLTKSSISTKTIRVVCHNNSVEDMKYDFKFNMTYVQNK